MLPQGPQAGRAGWASWPGLGWLAGLGRLAGLGWLPGQGLLAGLGWAQLPNQPQPWPIDPASALAKLSRLGLQHQRNINNLMPPQCKLFYMGWVAFFNNPMKTHKNSFSFQRYAYSILHVQAC